MSFDFGGYRLHMNDFNGYNSKSSKAKGIIGTLVIVLLIGAVMAFLAPKALEYIKIAMKKVDAPTNEASQEMVDSMKQEASNIENRWQSIISENQKSVQSVALSPSTIAYLEDKDNAELMEAELEYIKSFDAMMEDNSCTILSGTDGMQVLRAEGNLVDIGDREYFRQAMNDNSYVSDILVSKAAGTSYVTFSAPVKSNDGKIIGVVQRNYDLFNLHEMLAEETLSDASFMVDRTGFEAANSQYEVKPEDANDWSSAVFMQSDSKEECYKIDTGNGERAVYFIKDDTSGWTICVARALE